MALSDWKFYVSFYPIFDSTNSLKFSIEKILFLCSKELMQFLFISIPLVNNRHPAYIKWSAFS